MAQINRFAEQLTTRPFRLEPTTKHWSDHPADIPSHTLAARPEDRLTMPLPVVVFPVRPDGRPDRRRWGGTALAIGSAGITLALQELHGPLTTALIVGVQLPSGRAQFAGVEILSASPPGDRLTQVLGLFGGPADELLQPRNLTPRFSFDSMSFTFGLPDALLRSWQDVGVLQAVVIDRLLLCPRCHGLPSFRSGCGSCGSGRVVPHETANGDTAADVEGRRSYQCPDCRCVDATLVPINHCLHCEHRFPGHQAYEMVLRGYHAQRLDPHAFTARPTD